MKRHVLMLVGLLLLTAIVFAPVMANWFVAWDDQQEIYFNPAFNPVSWHELNRTWTNPAESVWMPLTYYAWGAIAAIAPRTQENLLQAAPFHAASLLCHLVAVAFVFLILRRLIGQDWPAFFGAAIFALHPIQVESFAWASELTTVLSGALVFAAMDQYLRALLPLPGTPGRGQGRGDSSARPQTAHVADARSSPLSPEYRGEGARFWAHLATATLLYIAALLTKPTAMILPVALVIIHVLLLRKHWKTLAITLAVWVPLAVSDLLIALRYQPATTIPSLPIHQRLLVAGDAVAFYLRKIVLPIGIAPDYGRWPQRIIAQPGLWWMIAVAFIVLAILAIRRAPRLSAGAAIVLLGLGPLLGLVKFDYQFYSTVADRYAYLAMFGIALIVAAILDRWRHRALTGIAVACVFAIGTLSFLQVLRWRDTRTLFEYTLSVRPDSFIAHKVLGLELSNSDPDAATHHFQAALQARPNDATTHYNFAELLVRRGDIPAATSEFEETIRLNPTHAKALNNLGIAMWRTRRFDEAQTYFERSIEASNEHHDEFADPHEHLATLLEASGDTEGAIRHLQEALRINPNLPGARRQLDSLMRGR